MNKQPEALRLADRLDLYATGDDHQQDIEAASAELRRLYAVTQKLHEENSKLWGWIHDAEQRTRSNK